MPRVRPGVSHGVLITMHVEEENELTEAKRWDATRAHAPAVSVNRMQKMVKEDTRNAVRTEKLFAKAGTPSWELGARPNIPMTFIEYPITPSPDVTTRGRFDFASVSEGEGKRRGGGKGRGRQQLQSLAWASPPTAKYAPLGNMDNLTGDQVHPSRFTNALVRLGGIKVVEPMAGTEDDSLEEHKRLVHGDSCEDVVRKGEYVYYSIEFPTHERHCWRANMSGNDVVRIDPEDPQAKPGTYYVGVLGVKNDSRYVIEVSIEQRLVNPPPVPSYQPPKGFALIRREVHRSDLRLNRVANGASLLSYLPEELSRGGHAHAEVKAVGHQ
ncbi:MAG: hypothetical protein SGPRY_012470, partial [Prymnesium sp.]